MKDEYDFSKAVRGKFFRSASEDLLQRALAIVTSDPETLGGEPVFRDTRIPVHLVATWIGQGATEAEILKAYPRLTCEMIQLASVYAQAHPQQDRPRQQYTLPLTTFRGPLPNLKE